MINKKQIIYDLERCTCHVPDACRDCSKHRHWSGNAVTCMESLMEDALDLLKEQEAQRDYEASVEMAEYCERYEQTYNPEDGSM